MLTLDGSYYSRLRETYRDMFAPSLVKRTLTLKRRSFKVELTNPETGHSFTLFDTR
jgi:hypothetical protein